jgi:hypothetical protein
MRTPRGLLAALLLALAACGARLVDDGDLVRTGCAITS